MNKAKNFTESLITRVDNNSSPAIQLMGLTKEFHIHGRKKSVVKNIDLDVNDGEFFSLLGPSGCGKSTTLKMMAGLEDPSRGAIRLYGEDVTWKPANHRDVNMVFQNYALFPHMNIFNNVAYGLRRKRVSKPEISRRVGEALDLVELTGYERSKPSQLSGGQQQRVALARALVNRPRALLLDEPLSALDLKLRQTMQVELKRIQKEVGISFIYVTHDQGEALAMSNTIAVMNEGGIEQKGTPEEIYERPASAFVAGFIGRSNILTGAVANTVDNALMLDFGEKGQIFADNKNKNIRGDDVSVIIRPETINIAENRPEENKISFLSGVVNDIIYQGSATICHVYTDIEKNIEVFIQNPRQLSIKLDIGKRLWLTWRSDDAYVI